MNEKQRQTSMVLQSLNSCTNFLSFPQKRVSNELMTKGCFQRCLTADKTVSPSTLLHHRGVFQAPHPSAHHTASLLKTASSQDFIRSQGSCALYTHSEITPTWRRATMPHSCSQKCLVISETSAPAASALRRRRAVVFVCEEPYVMELYGAVTQILFIPRVYV